MPSLDPRELARRAYDKLKVYNPTDEDYICWWDGRGHVIPGKDKDRGDGKGCRILERFLAEKYIREMTDKILLKKQDEAVKKENEKRLKEGKRPMEKWAGEDQAILEDKIRFEGGIQDPQARKETMRTLFLGVVEEYGMDLTPEIEIRNSSQTDSDLLMEIEREKNVQTKN